MQIVKKCHKCGAQPLVRRLANPDDALIFIFYCPACQSNAAKDDTVIPHTLINAWQEAGRFPGNIETVPLVEFETVKLGTCLVCGEEGPIINHNLMPYQLRTFVQNYEDWPSFTLCQKCSEQWYSTVCWYMPESEKETGVAAQVRLKYDAWMEPV